MVTKREFDLMREDWWERCKADIRINLTDSRSFRPWEETWKGCHFCGSEDEVCSYKATSLMLCVSCTRMCQEEHAEMLKRAPRVYRDPDRYSGSSRRMKYGGRS